MKAATADISGNPDLVGDDPLDFLLLSVAKKLMPLD